MTRPPRRTPGHHWTCYCASCRRLGKRYKVWYVSQEQPCTVSALTSQSLIRRLRQRGMTWNEIGAELGISGSGVRRILTRKRLHRETAERIRAAYDNWEPKRKNPGLRDRFDLDIIEEVLDTRCWKIPMSKYEKAEIVRRWVAWGYSKNSLERITGWNASRYPASLIPKEES